jgi:site-specific recombinase XerD
MLRRSKWSAHQRECAVSCLNRWCAWLDTRGVKLCDATGDDCSTYLAERAAAVAGSTVRKDYQFLRGLYAWLVAEDEIDTRRVLGPMHNIDAPTMSDPDPRRIRAVSEEDYHRLMATFRGGRNDRQRELDARNAAICSLMYWSGLRRSEVVRCDLDRCDLAAGTVDVIGKNGLWRTVPLTEETVGLLDRYLRRRGHDDGTALFTTVQGGAERTTSGRLSALAVSEMLERRCQKLGIDVTCHQFRRAMAINAGARGMEDTSVCNIAGWSTPRMLMRYRKPGATQLAVADFRRTDPTAGNRTRNGAPLRRTRKAS